MRLADVLKAAVLPRTLCTSAMKAPIRTYLEIPKQPISRGVPIEKALEDDCLLAFAMNGEPIPEVHGAPLRLIAPLSRLRKRVNG